MKKFLTLLSCLSLCILSIFLFTACNNNNNQNSYIISFMIENELYENILTTGDEEISFPLNPTKDGYVFDGWYIESNSQQTKISEKYFKTNHILSNVKVYAKFLPNMLNVTLNLNGGECSITSLEIKFGSEYELPIPQRNGYAFVGWYINNTKIENSTWIYDTQTITAKWEQVYIYSGNIITGITKYGKTLIELEIPAQIDGNDIKYIDEYAFKDSYSLKKIIIPNSIQEIGIGALSGCSSLEYVTIPFIGASESDLNTFGYIFGQEKYVGGSEIVQNKITYYIPSTLTKVNFNGSSITEYAFSNCKNLIEVTLNDDVTDIGGCAFYKCESLQNIIIPDSLTIIKHNTFNGCLKLKSVNFPSNLKTIEYNAFYDCRSLKTLTIPEKVVSIGNNAFDNCINVDVVYFNAIECNDIYYLSGAFENLGIETQGVTIYIGNKVKKIPSYLFSANSFPYIVNITNILFNENSVCSIIGGHAFYNSKIVSITLPNSVTEIEEYAFALVETLAYIVLNNNITTIGQGCFNYSTAFNTIYFRGTKQQFMEISFDSKYNEQVKNATVYYYSESQPLESGKYWHYNTDNNSILIWG